MAGMISFQRAAAGSAAGQQASGYLAEDDDPKAPGVVVLQEWWGLQGQIKAVCDRLATAGFHALAPDLFGGKVVPYHDKAGAQAAMGALDFAAATDQIVRGAVQYLAARGGKVGLTGFCMGGAVTVAGAVRIPELSAAVVFYGIPPESVARPADVRVPLQAHFAAHDDWCTPAVVDAFEQALRTSGQPCEVHRYPGHHAFMNPERKEVYDAASAGVAWERLLSWFQLHLS